jgi:hypothetical protein
MTYLFGKDPLQSQQALAAEPTLALSATIAFCLSLCRKPLINVPYKRTFGAPDQEVRR